MIHTKLTSVKLNISSLTCYTSSEGKSDFVWAICTFTLCRVKTLVLRHRPFFVSVNMETLFHVEAQAQFLMMNIPKYILLRLARGIGVSYGREN